MSAPQRRAQLLRIGRAVFAERGLDGASVEEIAARAGVSKPVVYEHFGGKDGLYAEVVDGEVQALLQRFTCALSGDSPRLLLEQATLALLTYVQDRRDGFRILVRESPVPGGTGGLATFLSDVARRVEHLLAEVFELRGFAPELAPVYSQALVGQVALVGQWWLDDAAHGRDVVAAHLVNLSWNGLAHLEPDPVLRDGDRARDRRRPPSRAAPPAGRASPPAGPGVDEVLAASRSGVRRLSARETAAAGDRGALVVDTRTERQRREQGELPGALVIDRTVLEWRLDPASPSRIPEATGYDLEVVVVCREGYSSSLAALSLRSLGLHLATDLVGGVEAWLGAGLPLHDGPAEVRL